MGSHRQHSDDPSSGGLTTVNEEQQLREDEGRADEDKDEIDESDEARCDAASQGYGGRTYSDS